MSKKPTKAVPQAGGGMGITMPLKAKRASNASSSLDLGQEAANTKPAQSDPEFISGNRMTSDCQIQTGRKIKGRITQTILYLFY